MNDEHDNAQTDKEIVEKYVALCNRCGINVNEHGSDHNFEPPPPRATSPATDGPIRMQLGAGRRLARKTLEPMDRLEHARMRAVALADALASTLCIVGILDADQGELRKRAHDWTCELEGIVCLLCSDCPERVEFPNDRD